MILLAILFSYQNTDQNWTAAGENLTSDENLFQEEKDGKDGSDKFSNDQELNYSGIYYLHDDLPEHGQDIGNTHDVGDLLRVEPHGKEERYCAKWVQFDFDEHVFGEITGDESYYIENI